MQNFYTQVIIVVALIAIAMPAFSADGEIDRKELLAEVGGTKITAGDVDDMLTSMDPMQRRSFESKEGRKYLLDIMIKNEMLLRSAKDIGLHKDEGIKKQIKDTTERLLISEYYKREIGAKLGISDNEVKAYYNSHKGDYTIPATISLHHILCETEEEAIAAKDRVLGGDDFEEVAKELSQDHYTAGGGGLIGSISEGYTPFQVGDCPGFENAVFSLDEKTPSESIKSDKGYHIFWIKNKSEESYKDIDLVASSIRNSMLIDESEIRDYYENHGENYIELEKVKIRQIVCETKNAANSAMRRAKSGEDFGELAALLTIDKPGKEKKGSIGWIRKGGFIQGIGTNEEFENLAFSLDVDEIGGPIELPDGWHIIKVEDHKDYREIPFEEVEESIRSELTSDKRQDRIEGEYVALESNFDVTRYGWARGYADMNLSELQAEAEEAMSPQTRIEIYETILKVFPDNESNDNALLMIGFIYSEEIKDFTEAKIYFDRLIKEHPNSENVESAQWMLDNMGIDNIEIPEYDGE